MDGTTCYDEWHVSHHVWLSIMRIQKKHLHHGAVLYQIADHPQFTAINALSNNVFRINDDIAVYPKYASNAIGDEYRFTFTADQLDEIASINAKGIELHFALVCVKDHAICALAYDDLKRLMRARRESVGAKESQYVVLVMYQQGGSFRVNMNAGGKKGYYLGNHILVKQNACPNNLFRS